MKMAAETKVTLPWKKRKKSKWKPVWKDFDIRSRVYNPTPEDLNPFSRTVTLDAVRNDFDRKNLALIQFNGVSFLKSTMQVYEGVPYLETAFSKIEEQGSALWFSQFNEECLSGLSDEARKQQEWLLLEVKNALYKNFVLQLNLLTSSASVRNGILGVLSQESLYGWARFFFSKHFETAGMETQFINFTNGDVLGSVNIVFQQKIKYRNTVKVGHYKDFSEPIILGEFRLFMRLLPQTPEANLDFTDYLFAQNDLGKHALKTSDAMSSSKMIATLAYGALLPNYQIVSCEIRDAFAGAFDIVLAQQDYERNYWDAYHWREKWRDAMAVAANAYFKKNNTAEQAAYAAFEFFNEAYRHPDYLVETLEHLSLNTSKKSSTKNKNIKKVDIKHIIQKISDRVTLIISHRAKASHKKLDYIMEDITATIFELASNESDNGILISCLRCVLAEMTDAMRIYEANRRSEPTKKKAEMSNLSKADATLFSAAAASSSSSSAGSASRSSLRQ